MPEPELQIRDIDLQDAAAIADIYNYYIRETVITFEMDPVDAKTIQTRIEGTTGRGHPYLVMELDGSVIGYAYADQWRSRIAYQHTVETAIYLAHDATGEGRGFQLYKALIDRLRDDGKYHAVIGGLTLPNPASERLHAKLGFQQVATFPQVGRKFDQWLDVKFMQLLLDTNLG